MSVQLDALKVIALDSRIRAFLLGNDPKALEQVENAIKELEPDWQHPDEGS